MLGVACVAFAQSLHEIKDQVLAEFAGVAFVVPRGV